ncbi:MAG TPA: hypothetical protein VF867_03195 [Arthrobacter sp.]
MNPAEYAATERIFARNFYNGEAPDTILSGDGPGYYLFTAPYASNTVKDGRRKSADRYTGSLAKALAVSTGSGWLAAAGAVSEWSYWDERRDAFTGALDDAVIDGKFVIDVNGVSARYGADIFIGYGSNPSEEALALADEIIYEFSEYRVVAGGKFNATSPRTVRSFIADSGGDALQLEVAPRLRNIDECPELPGNFITRFGTLLMNHAAGRQPVAVAA